MTETHAQAPFSQWQVLQSQALDQGAGKGLVPIKPNQAPAREKLGSFAGLAVLLLLLAVPYASSGRVHRFGDMHFELLAAQEARG